MPQAHGLISFLQSHREQHNWRRLSHFWGKSLAIRRNYQLLQCISLHFHQPKPWALRNGNLQRTRLATYESSFLRFRVLKVFVKHEYSYVSKAFVTFWILQISSSCNSLDSNVHVRWGCFLQTMTFKRRGLSRRGENCLDQAGCSGKCRTNEICVPEPRACARPTTSAG